MIIQIVVVVGTSLLFVGINHRSLRFTLVAFPHYLVSAQKATCRCNRVALLGARLSMINIGSRNSDNRGVWRKRCRAHFTAATIQLLLSYTLRLGVSCAGVWKTYYS